MPKVHVEQKYFDHLIGKSLGTHYFQPKILKSEEGLNELIEIGFDFGIEIEEAEENGKKIYVFEVAANRSDLLCAEGLAESLAIYIGFQEKIPPFQAERPNHHIIVKSSVRDLLAITIANELDSFYKTFCCWSYFKGYYLRSR